MKQIGNGLYGIDWSRDRRRHMITKGQGRDLIHLEPNISKTAVHPKDHQ